MEDLIEVLLGAIFEIFGEALLQILMEIIAALLSRAIRKLFVISRRLGPELIALILAVAGGAAGLFSLMIFPHPLVHPSRFHGVSLLISPVATGLVMALIGRTIRRRGWKPVRIESFGYGFVFALAMQLIRFALEK